jgi:hypothetical protein
MACKQSIQQGAEIARLLGKYVHQACKDRHLADIASRGRVEVLETVLEPSKPEALRLGRAATVKRNRFHLG